MGRLKRMSEEDYIELKKQYEEVDKEYINSLENGAASIFPPTLEPQGQITCFIADPGGNVIEIGSQNKK